LAQGIFPSRKKFWNIPTRYGHNPNEIMQKFDQVLMLAPCHLVGRRSLPSAPAGRTRSARLDRTESRARKRRPKQYLFLTRQRSNTFFLTNEKGAIRENRIHTQCVLFINPGVLGHWHRSMMHIRQPSGLPDLDN
jgi:hypothetical protein